MIKRRSFLKFFLCGSVYVALNSALPAMAQSGEIEIDSLEQIQGTKVALVIGNANYSVRRLKNPVNDARSMSDALRELGFSVVQRENMNA